MILSGQTIRNLEIIRPFSERGSQNGMSYGLSVNGYDVRNDLWLTIKPGEFRLASTQEQFVMPNNVVGIVHDKSTWARRGLVTQNTVIEAGWVGFLTLELTNHGSETITIEPGDPIAQIVFHFTDEPVERPYKGKYQNQERGPQKARYE